MKCFSRYTLGVFIGSIYILVTMILFILLSVFVVFRKNEDKNVTSVMNPDVPIIMTVCAITALISGVLVWGILKRRHNLLLPWLIMFVVGFIFSWIMFVEIYIGALRHNADKEILIILVFLTLLVTVLQIAIFLFICVLYSGIRKGNINEPCPVIGSQQAGYPAQSPYYTAVSNKL